MADRATIINKVQKLLALSQATSPEEAASAIAMAQRLMDKHDICEAVLDEMSGEEPAEEVKRWDEPLAVSRATWKGQLCRVLCDANGCFTYKNKTRGTFGIVGKESNVTTVRYMYRYCERAIDLLAVRQEGGGKTWINNYRMGCVSAIRDSIEAQQQALRDKLRSDAVGTSALVPLNSAIALVDQRLREAQEFAAQNLKIHDAPPPKVRLDREAFATGHMDGGNIYAGAGSPQLGAGQRALENGGK